MLKLLRELYGALVMGFIRANMIPILKEHKRIPFSGKLLLLGAPDVYFGMNDFKRMAQTVQVDLDDSVEVTESHNAFFRKKGYISGDTLFKSIGFESITIMDYSDFEGATLIHDLNSPDVPQEFFEQFDVIIDHGTLEHVFHIPNALQAVFKFLKKGGRMIHCLPTSNCVDHGFYMFSPTFFYDFYTTNNWEINNIYVVSMTPRQETEPFFYTEYEPGNFDRVSYGGLDSKIYSTLSFTTKTSKSSAHLIPQQGIYKNNPNWK